MELIDEVVFDLAELHDEFLLLLGSVVEKLGHCFQFDGRAIRMALFSTTVALIILAHQGRLLAVRANANLGDWHSSLAFQFRLDNRVLA